MKRILALIIAVMLLSTIVFTSITTSAETSGDFQYEILQNGTAKITKYTGSASELLIPDTINGCVVTELGWESFKRCNTLVSVTIPNSVATISSYAFDQCEKLESVTLPDSIDTVAYGMFSGCERLNHVIIPEGVKIIDTYAFSCCFNLKSIHLPDSLVVIERNAFDSTGLTEITIPDHVVTIGSQAFIGCLNLEKVTLSADLKVIYSMAFYSSGEKLKSIYIPEDVEFIDKSGVGFIVGDNGKPTPSPGYIIYGKAGTAAEAFAVKNGITFREAADSPAESQPADDPSTEPHETEKPTSSPFGTFILGDSDGDGTVTILDATAIQRYLAGLPTKAEGIGEPLP